MLEKHMAYLGFNAWYLSEFMLHLHWVHLPLAKASFSYLRSGQIIQPHSNVMKSSTCNYRQFIAYAYFKQNCFQLMTYIYDKEF
jgi:hypothetical protein